MYNSVHGKWAFPLIHSVYMFVYTTTVPVSPVTQKHHLEKIDEIGYLYLPMHGTPLPYPF